MSMLSDFVSLIFPAKCSGCQSLLIQSEKAICSSCFIELNECAIKNYDPNFSFGRKKIDGFFCSYFLIKNSILQKIIHNIKFKNDRLSAHVLGVELGKRLKEFNYNDKIDCIVPVPISKKKLRARTFNQSEEIAKGLKTVVDVPIVINWLKRKNGLKSQTLSNRFQRSINVKEEYYLNKKKTIENKRLLILDDVITTGATLQSCLEALESNKNKSIYVVALAATKKD